MIFYIILISSSLLLFTNSFYLVNHPYEKKIAYIYGIKNLLKIETNTINNLQDLWKMYPLLIFKELEYMDPIFFIDFIKNFDNSLNNNEFYHKILLLYEKSINPKDKMELLNFYNIKDNIIKDIIMYSDISGNEYKFPNKISSFYLMEESCNWGETDFISGEKIFEELENYQKNYINNLRFDLNIDSNNFLESIPIPFIKETTLNSKVLLKHSFVPKRKEETENWVQKFMYKNVFPYKTNIKWEKGDLVILNNEEFIHSNTPGWNYINNKNNLEKNSFEFIKKNNKNIKTIPYKNNIYASYNIKWKPNDNFYPINNYPIKPKILQNKLEYKNKLLLSGSF